MDVWSCYSALPAYFGGKSRLAPMIFSLLQEALLRSAWSSRRLLDPFLGRGAVSLYAKAQGFEVLCNDLARRSTVIGRGLIANGSTRLTITDLGRLLGEPTAAYDSLAEDCFSPWVFPKAHARLLDRTLHNIDLEEPKRSLATVLVTK